MICPNCNNMIPDGSIRCNYCGYSTNSFAVNRNTQQLMSYPQVQPQQQYYASQPQYYAPQSQHYQNNTTGLDRNSIILIASIIGLASVVLEFFGTIAPVFKIYTSYDSYSESLSNYEFVIWFWIDCIVLFLYSLPGVRYIRADGIGKVLFGTCGLLGTFYLISYLRSWFAKQSFDGVLGTVNMSFQAGIYLLFIAHILTFVSGIILIVYGYKNKHDVELSRKADGSAKKMIIIEATVFLTIVIAIIMFIYVLKNNIQQ